MLDNGIIGLGFGAYLGVLYHAKHYPGLLTKRLLNETLSKQLLRVCLGLALCLPLLSLYFLSSKQIGNVYLLSLLKTFTPTFASGFIVFGPLDEACQCMGLLTFRDSEHDS